MIWAALAGILAGLVLGFLGAGGTVIAIPILLIAAGINDHTALGTNALGVALAAWVLFIWRYRERRTGLRETVISLVPGIGGIYAGATLGLEFPGKRLIFLLGILLFFVAAWMLYVSTRPKEHQTNDELPGVRQSLRKSTIQLGPLGFVIGSIAGFFGIGGGFLIVPALAFAGSMPLELATVMSLLPIGGFALTIGGRYLAAGNALLSWSVVMTLCGIAGGIAGSMLNRRLPRTALQRAFAALLVAIGMYFILR